ncbi:hypothetical protein PHISP_05722 [Aspergillus sp. HF37]|nr:hypothetical protein PHISP_05722 [Aspergillus sp. HF37]
MESTRIFVSGLPPKFSNDQLKKHFSSRFQTTDAHVLPNRRFGFVGFKSPEAAKEAVGYFNKSYVKMSKISVEIARPINSAPVDDANRKASVANDSAENTLKRKRGAEDAKQDPKLQEYISVLQRPSKSKTWTNDEEMLKPVEDQPPASDEGVKAGEDSVEASDTQRKKAKVAEPGKASHHSEPEPMVVDHSGRGDDPDQSSQQDSSAATQTQNEPVSDADWLRSKTSRLLGLLGDEERAEFDTAAQQKNSNEAEASGNQENRDAEETPAQSKDADETEKAPEVDTNVELIRSSARLFVRNLPYDAKESDLGALFAPFGKVEEIHVAFDTRFTTSKGFAYIQYFDSDAAIEAYRNLDGKNFQGRLLHILPASAKKTYKIDEHELSKLPVKRQKQIKRRMDASSATFSWNSLYMNSDAVMASVAERIGVPKGELLDPTSSDAAVKQAHAETHVIQETKAYFTSNGVNIDAFKQRERGNTAILVKNFSYGVKSSDLRKLFEEYGQLTRLLMPPSGTIAIVEFARPDEAQKAFKSLAYRKLGDSILFLEKAPKDLFETAMAPSKQPEVKAVSQGFSTADTFAADEPDEGTATSTLFVKNLNFSTTNEKLVETFQPLDGFVSARVKTKPDPKNPGQKLSMGFGFVDFRTKASHKAMDAAEERRREDTAKKVAARRTKIIIKNLPFQATKKDVRSLFGSYGQLRSVRVPKKFDRSARGFGFADFVSAREAENAMDALKSTHLLGRKLVLEFASEEAVDPEEEIQQIEKKVGQQLDRVKLQKLTGSGRKKFTVGAQDDDEE